MDRNQVVGLVLMTVLLVVYFFFLAPPAEESAQPNMVEQLDTLQERGETQLKAEKPEVVELADSLRDQVNLEKFGAFAANADGTPKNITIENEDAIFTFSTKGGVIKRTELKKYQTYDKEPLILIDEAHSEISFSGSMPSGFIDFSDLFFRTNAYDTQIESGDTLDVVFEIQSSGGGKLQYVYRIPGSGYKVDYDVIVSNLDHVFNTPLTFQWINHQKKFEKDIKDVRQKSTIKYFTTEGDFDGLDEGTSGTENENLEDPIQWVSSKQKFFNTAIISDDSYFTDAKLTTAVDENDPNVVKTTSMRFNVPVDNYASDTIKMAYYLGPNDYKRLKKVAPEFQQIVYLGYPLVSWVNKWIIINVFSWLETFIGNYGIIILILVFIIKLILSPLSYKSYVSMAKTKVLKPEIDEIKERHDGDMQKVQQEQMQLYQKVGVNPLSGCIPLVLQMPILLAMFFFFPNSIELRGEAFLWAEDLSTYDSILSLPFSIPAYGNHVSLFTLLMTASTILITWSNQQVSTVQGPMKSISYMMPIVFMFVLNSLPAALSYYYFVSNLITYGQQALIKRFVDESKIRQILEENKKKNKNKKKSKFQQRMEEAMKAAEKNKKKK